MTLSGFSWIFVMGITFISCLFSQGALAQYQRDPASEEEELDLDQESSTELPPGPDDSQIATGIYSPKAKVKAEPEEAKVQKKPLPSVQIKESNDPEVRLARTAFKMKKYDEAERLFWKHVEKLTLFEMKMMMYSSDRVGKSSDAIKAAKLILGRVGDDADAYTLIGKMHAQKTIQKDSEKLAIENLKRAIEVNPKFEPAYLALTAFYEKKIKQMESRKQNKKKNYYELRILYQEMAEKFPQKPQYQSQVCKIDALDEQLELAKESCKLAMVKSPKDPIGFVYMGIAQQKAKNDDEAKRLLSSSVKRFKNSDLANLSWAAYLETNGNFIDAYNFFKAAAVINPQSGEAWAGVARTGIQLSKEDESLQAFRKACGLAPQEAGVDLRKAIGTAKKIRGKLELMEESCR